MAQITRRKLLRAGFWGAASLIAGDAFAVEPNWVEVVHITVTIQDLPRSFEGYRIAQLSDFHYPNHINAEAIRDCFALAAQHKPDIFALTGDFVHGHDFLHGRYVIESLKEPFGGVTAPDGVLAVLGNHDHWYGKDEVLKMIANDTSFQMLDNARRVLKRGDDELAFVGLSDLWQGGMDYKQLSALPPNVPRILLEHNPDLCEEMPEGYRVDLQLSGHTHGGQVRIPLGPAPIIPTKYGQKYRAGLVQGPRHRVYVNRGIGNASPVSIRLASRPEVTIITLTAV